MKKIKNTTKIELTNLDNGKTEIVSYGNCVKRFGKAEFNEMLQGYLPNWVAVEIS